MGAWQRLCPARVEAGVRGESRPQVYADKALCKPMAEVGGGGHFVDMLKCVTKMSEHVKL